MPQRSAATGVESDVPASSRTSAPRHRQLAGVIAVGGAIGAAARYAAQVGVPAPDSGFPLAILLVNMLGCALIGVLMVVIERVLDGQVFVRPFLGVGVLGGFTTFSTYAVDSAQLLAERPYVALANLVATPVLAVVAAVLGTALAELALRSRTPGGSR